jgi:long-chain acyl-CoA synthetase
MVTLPLGNSASATIGGALLEMSKRAPDSVALKVLDDAGNDSHNISFRQLYIKSRLRAGFLAKQFRPGDRIMILAGDGPEWFLLQYACALAGLVLVACDPEAPAHDIRDKLVQTRSVAVFHDVNKDDLRMANITLALKGLPNILGVFAMQQTFSNLGDHFGMVALPDVAPSDPAIILYTSGTTGKPKGIIHSHAAILFSAQIFGERTQTNENSIWGRLSPMHHVGGCVIYSIVPLVRGNGICLLDRLDPNLVLDLIERGNITIFWAVPTLLISLMAAQQIRKRNLTNLTAIVGGGADVPHGLVRQTIDTFDCRYHSSYAMTEFLDVSLSMPDDRMVDVLTTSGKLFDDVSVSVRDLENGNELPAGQIGEIFVRGPGGLLGYCGQDDELDIPVSSDDWFQTGDLGSVDERGYITVTARLKDVINRGGETISPFEIEAAIALHHDVVNVAVIGLPSLLLGEFVAAFVELRPESVMTHDALVAHCRKNLKRSNVPASFYLVPMFPLTESGKIKKRLLKEGAKNGVYRRLKTVKLAP